MHSHTYVLYSFYRLVVWTHDALFARPLVAENITMTAQEDIISLIVQSHGSPSLELGLSWEHAFEQMCCQHSERGSEVVEDKFGVEALVLSMPRQFLSFYPVRDGEMEVRASGK